MACEFFKVSLYFFIYDRWLVSVGESAAYREYNTSVITSKTALRGEISEIPRISRNVLSARTELFSYRH